MCDNMQTVFRESMVQLLLLTAQILAATAILAQQLSRCTLQDNHFSS